MLICTQIHFIFIMYLIAVVIGFIDIEDMDIPHTSCCFCFIARAITGAFSCDDTHRWTQNIHSHVVITVTRRSHLSLEPPTTVFPHTHTNTHPHTTLYWTTMYVTAVSTLTYVRYVKRWQNAGHCWCHIGVCVVIAQLCCHCCCVYLFLRFYWFVYDSDQFVHVFLPSYSLSSSFSF